MAGIRVIPISEVTSDICEEQDTFDRMNDHPGMLFHFRCIQEAQRPIFALGGFTSDKIHFVIVPYELYQTSLVGYLRQIAREQFPHSTASQIDAFVEKILDADEYEWYYNFYRRASMRMRKTDPWLKKYELFLRRSEPVPEDKKKVRIHKKRKGSKREN